MTRRSASSTRSGRGFAGRAALLAAASLALLASPAAAAEEAAGSNRPVLILGAVFMAFLLAMTLLILRMERDVSGPDTDAEDTPTDDDSA